MRCWRCATSTMRTATSRKSSSRISGPSPARAWQMPPAPDVDEHLWTIAVARLMFEPAMNIQAPPNLSPAALGRIVAAGINDWGGVSPVTPDHVNPEAPWPHLRVLEARPRPPARSSIERLAIYPAYARDTAPLGRSAAADSRCSIASTATACRASTTGVPAMSANCRRANSAGSTRRRRRRPSASLGRVLAKAQRGDALDGARDRRSVPRPRRRLCRGLPRRRRTAPRRQRRRRQLRRHAQHQLHQHLLLQVPVLRLLERQDEREPARPALRSRHAGDRRPRRARHGSAARPKSACRAASIRPIPGRNISISAAR